MNNKFRPRIAPSNLCTGCMACIDSCHKSALTLAIGEDGHYFPKFEASKCVSCGLCEKVCPPMNVQEYGSNQGKSKPYAAWACDHSLRMNSTSGGVFAALAKKVIRYGGYVVGATSVGCIVKHVIINKEEDIGLLQGSKYLQSQTVGIFQKTKQLLDEDKLVLFSGTGCQVAGLLSYLKREYDKLITIDLACAGVPSNFAVKLYCKEENIIPEKIRWRDKENGWKHGLEVTIYTKDKNMHFDAVQPFFAPVFLSGMTNRISCYDCKFTGTDRMSDITIADFWGCKDFPDEEFNGISLMIVHSKKGNDFISNAREVEFHKTTWNDCVRHNPRIVLGNTKGRKIPIERRILPYAIRHFNYKTMRILYGGESGNILWLPLRIHKFINWKLNVAKTNKRVDKILAKL